MLIVLLSLLLNIHQWIRLNNLLVISTRVVITYLYGIGHVIHIHGIAINRCLVRKFLLLLNDRITINKASSYEYNGIRIKSIV